MRLLCRWMKENVSDTYGRPFQFTVRALGKLTGGKLGYYPDDDKCLMIELLKFLPSKRVTKLDISNKFHLIDGNREYFVDDFKGERFSVVFVTCRRFRKAPPAVRKSLAKCCGRRQLAKQSIKGKLQAKAEKA